MEHGRLARVEQKIVVDDDFSLDESQRSELKLSVSRNQGRATGEYRDRDSLVFQFEPEKEKKKGMSVASK